MKAKKLIGLLLLLCLMLGTMPTLTLGGAAEEGPAEAAGIGANANTADAATVYYGGKTWRVIGYDGTGVISANGTMTLLSDYIKPFIQYDYSSARSNVYSTSSVKKYINSDIWGVFSQIEKDAIIGRTLEGNGINEDENRVSGATVEDEPLWPLSTAEANAVDQNIRRKSYKDDWKMHYSWLRTPGADSRSAAYMTASGTVVRSGASVDTKDYGLRPAGIVDLEAILFTTAHAGGKPYGIGLKPYVYPTNNEWDLTLLDGSRTFSVAETAVSTVPGGKVTLTYSSSVAGSGEYCSAMLFDQSGSVLYYARLARLQENATVDIEIPAELAEGSYTLSLFSEHEDGANSDTASAFSDVALTVSSNAPLPPADESEPVTVSTWAQICDAVSRDGFIQLAADISDPDNNTLGFSYKTVLDLNGHVLSTNIFVWDGGELTIIDSTPSSEHPLLTYTDPTEEFYFVEGQLNEDGTEKELTRYPVTGGAIYGSCISVYGGKLTLKAGTVTGSTRGAIDVSYGGICIMEGGLIAGNTGKCGEYETDYGSMLGGYIGVYGTDSVFHMKGGVITCNAPQKTCIIQKTLDPADQEAIDALIQSRKDCLASDATIGICAHSKGTFVLEGGTVSNNLANTGSGVTAYRDGIFNMLGGEIRNNVAAAGGGVCVYMGTFYMSGGRISGNKAIVHGGGGVITGSKLTYSLSLMGNNPVLDDPLIAPSTPPFTLMSIPITLYVYITGGLITENTCAGSGGGIEVGCRTHIEISGGAAITNNTSAVGGGISVPDSYMKISLYQTVEDPDGVTIRTPEEVKLWDCTITGNTAADCGGGIYKGEIYNEKVFSTLEAYENGRIIFPATTLYVPESVFSLNGKAVIFGNTAGSGDDPEDDNLYLAGEGHYFTVEHDLSDSIIDVKTAVKPETSGTVVFTKGLSQFGSTTLFESDDPSIGVKLSESGEAQLGHYAYDASMLVGEHGSASAAVEGASGLQGIETGTPITVTIDPDEHYELSELTAKYGTKECRFTSVGENVYTFNMPNADVVISATFALEKFEITWKILDSEEKEQYEYNTTPAHADPQIENTAKYTYVFNGWDKQITPATKDETYTALIDILINSYTIVFADEDGTVLQSGSVPYDETPVFTGSTPDKETPAGYTYTFRCWDQRIAAVTGDATYTAIYAVFNDQNGDDMVNINDVTTLLDCLANGSSDDLYYDVDGDETVSITDVSALLDYLTTVQ